MKKAEKQARRLMLDIMNSEGYNHSGVLNYPEPYLSDMTNACDAFFTENLMYWNNDDIVLITEGDVEDMKTKFGHSKYWKLLFDVIGKFYDFMFDQDISYVRLSVFSHPRRDNKILKILKELDQTAEYFMFVLPSGDKKIRNYTIENVSQVDVRNVLEKKYRDIIINIEKY